MQNAEEGGRLVALGSALFSVNLQSEEGPIRRWHRPVRLLPLRSSGAKGRLGFFLARDGRSLCLLIERVNGGAVVGRACLQGQARASGHPRIRYTRVLGPGAGHGQQRYLN